MLFMHYKCIKQSEACENNPTLFSLLCNVQLRPKHKYVMYQTKDTVITTGFLDFVHRPEFY
jgi:hypothetical protein